MRPTLESVLQCRRELIADIQHYRLRNEVSYAEANIMLNILAGYYDHHGDESLSVAKDDVAFTEQNGRQ